ncbi:MAG: hypothetical protein ACI971_000826, partial [Colwellia sp.]
MELKKIAVYNEVLFTQIITFMTFPNDETGQILAEMQDAGIDLSIIHPVVFFQLFEKK